MGGDLESAARGGECVVDKQLLVVLIVPAQRVHHHVGGQIAHPHSPRRAEPLGRAAALGDFGGELLGAGVERGEEISLGSDEAPRLGQWIGSERLAASVALFGQRALLAAVGTVQPQQRLAHPGRTGCEIGHLERGEVDVGEQRIAQHLAQSPRIIVAVFGSEFGHVELVGACEPQQQIGGERTLVPLEQRDVGRRNAQVGGHRLLGQPQLAAQSPQSGSEVNRALASHVSDYCTVSTT